MTSVDPLGIFVCIPANISTCLVIVLQHVIFILSVLVLGILGHLCVIDVVFIAEFLKCARI